MAQNFQRHFGLRIVCSTCSSQCAETPRATASLPKRMSLSLMCLTSYTLRK